jgi:two-component system, NarL family, invasion response regulator UvrY
MCHILIIDDHPLVSIGIRAIVGNVIERSVFNFAYTYQDGIEALAGNHMDLIILDLAIPGSKGPEMITEFRKIQQDVRILVCSGRDELTYATLCLQHGANGFLHKNSLDSEASRAIKVVLGNRKYISERLKNVMLHNLVEGNSTNVNPVDSLGRREKQVFNLLLQGKYLKEIAAEMNVTISTVGNQKTQIFKKLQVNNMVELIRRFSPSEEDSMEN